MKISILRGLSMVLAISALVASAAAAQTIIPIGSGLQLANGIAVDGADNVFVAAIGGGGAFIHGVYLVPASGGYVAGSPIGNGMTDPVAASFDSHGNLFVAQGTSVIEFTAASGLTLSKTIASGYISLKAVALDHADNLFFAESFGGAIYEASAAGGYAAIRKIGSGFVEPQGLAVDSEGDVFVADSFATSIKEIEALQGVIPPTPTIATLGSGLNEPCSVAVDAKGNVFVAELGNNDVVELPAVNGFRTTVTLATGFNTPSAIALDGSGDLFVADSYNKAIKEIMAVGGSIPPAATVVTRGSGFHLPLGITLDSAGDVIVADSGSVAIKKILAAGGYATTTTLCIGFATPNELAVDGDGNVFVTDTGTGAVLEVPAEGGYATTRALADGFVKATGIAVDQQGNVYVADYWGHTITEIAAADGSVTTILGGSIEPWGIAVDSGGNLLYTESQGLTIKKIAVVDGVIPVNPTPTTLIGNLTNPLSLALDKADNIYLIDGGYQEVKKFLASEAYATVHAVGSGIIDSAGVAADAAGNVFVTPDEVEEVLAAPPTLLASVLPGSRSVQIGKPATVFATVLNTGTSALDNCAIALPPAVSGSGLTLSYQTTDPATNLPTGLPNTPATIAGGNGEQSFLVSLVGSVAYGSSALPLSFGCDGAPPAATVSGIDTLALTVSAGPTADIIAISATPTNNGIVEIPNGGAGAFAVASTNIGASDTITVSINTGVAVLPLTATICQTDSTSGQCLAPPAPQLSLAYDSGTVPTFSVFLTASGPIDFLPATSRIFVQFTDATKTIRGATSVAVETVSP